MGKSYVNFLSYYVFDLFANNGLFRFLSPKIEGKIWKDKQLSFSFTLEDMRSWMATDAKSFLQNLMAYPELNCSVSFSFEESVINKIEVSVKEEELENNESSVHPLTVTLKDLGNSPAYSFNNDYARSISGSVATLLSLKIVFGEIFYSAYLLPPGRTSLIGNSFSVNRMVSNTGMYDRFFHDYDILRNPRFGLDINSNDGQFFMSQIRKLIGGDIITEKEDTFLLLDNGKKIPISAAASSIRELSPLLLWVKNRSLFMSSICLEEPEAHAHPRMQFGIADLIGSCLQKGLFFQITTHSDYFLTRINQLIRLYKFQQEKPQEFENSPYVRNKRQTINPQNVKAYYFDFSKEKNSVLIKEQNLEEGIPFDSFRDVIMRQIEFDNNLEQLITDDNE